MSAGGKQVRYDLDAIRAAVGLRELCAADGVVFHREGSNWVASCPFHEQKGRSFTIHGGSETRAHCYGCGWNGDVFAYWCESRGLSSQDREGFRQAVEALAARVGICGVSARAGKSSDRPVKIRTEADGEATRETTLERKQKPWLPAMRLLRNPELDRLSALRGISRPALEAAAADRRLGFAYWPVDRETGREDSRSRGSWVITDPERWCAQFRTLDGSCYVGRDGNEFKSYSTANVCWPVGAAQTGDREQIAIVEGGADMLAAYQLALEAGMLERVAVWCIFGSSVRICREALAAARGKRVRIFADNDEPQTKTFKRRPPLTVRPGMEGAERWMAQFLSAGAAAVDVYDLEPLGPDAGDLNDVVRAGTADLDLEHFFDF